MTTILALRSRRFLEYWTLKEAFVKALGRGLSVPLDQFSFHFRPDGLALTLSGALAASERDVDRWRFFQGEIAPSHVLAVACSLSRGVPLEISFHPVAPLLLNAP